MQVLYFRSLKNNKVLQLLTKYLFQYRTVSIPQVGTFQLVQHRAQLNVVDKLILPPTFTLELRQGDNVADHQLDYLNKNLGRDKHIVLDELQALGGQLKEKINGGGLHWDGIGTISQNTQTLPIAIAALEAVPAQRVIRQDARHKVLVGDQQRLSGQPLETDTPFVQEKRKRSLVMIIGWAVLILSILAIAFLLYQGKFRVVDFSFGGNMPAIEINACCFPIANG